MKMQGLSLEQAPPEDIPFRFFMTAPIFGMLAGVLVLTKGSLLFLTLFHPESIALTHLITLGWLAMIMMGAFYQMVPVLVGGQVPFIRGARVVHALLVIGILSLVSSFLYPSTPFYFNAFLFLLSSCSIFVIQISIALFSVKADRPVVLAMRMSILSLALAVGFGITILGLWAQWWEIPVSRITLRNVHLLLGFWGWIGGLIMGVGFHVIPMFYLASGFPLRTATWILRGILFSLLAIPGCLFGEVSEYWVWMACAPGSIGALVFVIHIQLMLMKRKRKIVDTSLRFWQTGLVMLVLALGVMIANFWSNLDTLPFLVGFSFIVGFAVSITQGMLYKIVPFLIWFHRYSSLVGKVRVPFLKDIVSDSMARKQWYFYLGLLATLTLGILVHNDLLIRLGGLFLFLSSGFLFINLFKAIRMKPQLDT
ncbi:hypothetical protein WDW89_03070 [Deltaproteobacteria bacterium TL4]